MVPETPTLDGKPSSFEGDEYKPAAADNPAYCPSHRDVSQIDELCYRGHVSEIDPTLGIAQKQPPTLGTVGRIIGEI